MDTPTPVFLMAVNADAYQQYRARFDPADVGAPGATVTYLHDDYQLQGVRHAIAVITSSAYLHPNYREILDRLRAIQVHSQVRVYDVRDGVRLLNLTTENPS